MRRLIESKGARHAGVAASVMAALALSTLAVSAWSDPSDTAAATRGDDTLHDAMAKQLLARTDWTGLQPTPVPGLELASAVPADAQAQAEADVVPAAAPFFLQARSQAERNRAIRCLATAIYFESALEPEEGQRAVAQVVLNRVRDPNFPKSVCGVVYQGWERTTGCQFSFTCDGALLRGQLPLLYARAEDYARDALSGHVVPEVGTATHYHTHWVSPYWAPTLTKITQVGAHIFYRWPGSPGMPQSFTGRYRGGELALSEAVLTGRAARPTPPAEETLLTDNLLIKTVMVADPAKPGAEIERVRGVLQPGGRRLPTPADVAQINARLEAFESGRALSAVPPPPLAFKPATLKLQPAERVAPAATGQAVDVIEVNKPAPKPAEE